MSTPTVNSKTDMNESHIGSTSRFNMGLKSRINHKNSMLDTNPSGVSQSKTFINTASTGVFKTANL